MSSSDASVATRIVLRPLGSPLALGALGLVLATGVLSAVQLGWVPRTETHVAAITALAATAPLQLVSSIIGFLDRDTVVGTGMGVLSGTWAAFGLATSGTAPGATVKGLGALLIAAGLCMLVPAAAGTTKVAPASVMALAGVHFGVGGAYQLTASTAWETASGWVGLLLGVVALYVALALVLEGSHHRTVLPLGRRGTSLTDLRGEEPLSARDLAAEPGVRGQL